jgi:hypothetical protein
MFIQIEDENLYNLSVEVGQKYLWQPCILHLLHLVVSGVFSNNHLVEKVRSLMVRIRRSSTTRQLLRNYTELQPVLDVKTRWNTVLAMLDRFIEIEGPINDLLAEKPDIHEGFRPGEISQVIQLRTVHIFHITGLTVLYLLQHISIRQYLGDMT